MKPTKRDLIVSVLTTGMVLAATYYGGPLAGKATKVVVVPRVEQGTRLLWEAFDHRDGKMALCFDDDEWCRKPDADPPQTVARADILRAAPPAPAPRAKTSSAWARRYVERLERRVAEFERREQLERTTARALLSAGVFPVTTHEARP